MPIVISQRDFSDFEALRNAVQDAPMDVVQLEYGKISGTLAHLSVGSLGISTGSFSRGLRFRGALSEQRWQIGMTLDAPASIEHVETIPGDLNITAPHHEFYSHHDSGNRYAAMLIAPSELFAYLDSQQPGASETPIWKLPSVVLNTDPAIAAANVRTFRTLFAGLTAEAATMPDEVLEFYKRNILELVTEPLLNTVSYRGQPLKSEAQLVREVDRFLVDARSRPIHISELCAQFKVHRRALHRAFINALGVPPIAFLRRMRLGDVHTALLTARPAATVKQIAMEHGFLELGRFAAAYRQMFGELPSTTLRRARVVQASWWRSGSSPS